MRRWSIGLALALVIALVAGEAQAARFFHHGGGGSAAAAPMGQFTAIALSCGTGCQFVSGVAGVIGTATATLSSGTVTGTWDFQTSGTATAGGTCNNYGANIIINSTSGVISNISGAPAQSYPGLCPRITQANITNSPYSAAFTVTGLAMGMASNNVIGSLCNGGVTSCTLASSNSTTGNLGVIGVWWGSDSRAASISDLTGAGRGISDNHGNVCIYSGGGNGSFGTIPTNARATAIFACPITAGATASTWTVQSAVEDYIQLYYAECVGCKSDSGLSNHSQGTSTAVSVAASGPVSGSSLAFVMIKDEGANTLTAGSGWTLLNTRSGSPDLDEYQIASSGTFNGTATADVSGGWSASIAVFGPTAPALSGISPSTVSFTTPVSSGTLATFAPVCTPGPCFGVTFAEGTGTPPTCPASPNFAIASNGAITPTGTVNAGTYTVGVNLTMSAASNSPQCYQATMNGSNSAPTGVVFAPTSATVPDNTANGTQIATLTITTSSGTYNGSLVTNNPTPAAGQFGITTCTGYTLTSCPFSITGSTGAWIVTRNTQSISDGSTGITVTAN